MRQKLLKIAKYLSRQGLYQESAQVKKLAQSGPPQLPNCGPGLEPLWDNDRHEWDCVPSAFIQWSQQQRTGPPAVTMPYDTDPTQVGTLPGASDPMGWRTSPGATGGRGLFNDNDWTISANDLYDHAPNILAYIKTNLGVNQSSYDFVIDGGRLYLQKSDLWADYEEIIPNWRGSSNWKAEATWIVSRGASEGIVEAKYYLDSILGVRNPGGFEKTRDEFLDSLLEADPYVRPDLQ